MQAIVRLLYEPGKISKLADSESKDELLKMLFESNEE